MEDEAERILRAPRPRHELFATARERYTAALTIAERLAATDSGNTQWQRDLSASHHRLGNVAVAAGDTTTARERYTAALTIAVRLAATDPTNVGWQRDVSEVRERLDRLDG